MLLRWLENITSSIDPLDYSTAPVAVPFLSVDQMITVDQLMMGPYGISLIQMMENAGLNLARLARARFLDGKVEGKRVVVLAGTGGNGGGAFVAARRLSEWGADVTVATTKAESEYGQVPAHQLAIIRKLELEIRFGYLPTPRTPADLIIDGIFGYSLRGEPRGLAADFIRWGNKGSSPILSLDTPSGLDLNSGVPSETCTKADATMTLALPKVGLAAPAARPFVGELYLADIGVPRKLYADRALGLTVGNIFSRGEVVRVQV